MAMGRGDSVTADNRQRITVVIVMCAAVSLYFVWVALTAPAFFQLPAWAAWFGAALFALFALRDVPKLRHPERYDFTRPTTGDRIAMFVEGGSYLIAGLMGLDWLIESLLGRAGPPGELQRAGVWIVGIVAVGLLVLLVRRNRSAG
jgi:hypothetical protein